jgi:hypothetical protein
VLARVQQAVRALDPEQRLAGLAAAGLLVTMFLPWYRATFLRPLEKTSFSAFGVFSFVEGAILLVALGIFVLLFARGERRGFHLPGGDGTVIMGAGAWAVLLLVWRLFDKPDVDDPGATVGIQWGMFAALLAAGLLVAAGARVRAAHRPEPPNPAADDAGWEHPERAAERHPERRPREATAVTEALRDRPGWEGEPPEAPGRAERRSGVVERDEPPDDRDRLF